MAWFKRKDSNLKNEEKKTIPDGLWEKCSSCNEILFKPELEKNLHVCHHCKHHFRIPSNTYLELLLDINSSKEILSNISSKDFLKFETKKKYSEQIVIAQKKTGDKDAIKIYQGTLEGHLVVLGVMNFSFIGGSMGSVVGESVSKAIALAGKDKCPFILVCASGGARMQEGAISLMQLAKTSTRLAKFSKEGGLYIPILTDPTTGGVTASFGMLGDIIIAEPGALIGFAGPRVIKQTIGQDLPQGFQKSEFLMEKGFIDSVVGRGEMKGFLNNIIKILT